MSEYYLVQRNFPAALKETREVLALYPKSLGDQALFQMGLIFVSPNNPERNVVKAQDAFLSVVRDYPESKLKYQAQLWASVLQDYLDSSKRLTVREGRIEDLASETEHLKETLKEQQSQIKRLQEQHRKTVEVKDLQIKELEQNIDKLKEVDLKIEEKKRKANP